MSNKIIAGAAMIAPSFFMHAYLYSSEYNTSIKESLKETGKLWIKWGGIVGVATTGYLGLLHVMLGVRDLSPAICSGLEK